MQELPVEEIKPRFQKCLEQSPVVVEAPPGSGKSTRLPLWCAEQGRVLVVEPRRLACRSLADYTARSLGQDTGRDVGYAIRFETRACADSRIVFATPGIALRWYAGDALSGFDTVILDEFHERNWDSDLLAALIREDKKQLVLASATVEGEKLASYLRGCRLQAQGKMYEVQIRYREKDTLPRTKDLDKRVADAVLQVLDRAGDGDVLVFLPGKGEIMDVETRLKKRRIAAEIIPLHASVDPAVQDRALQPGNGPRVILATNVAETSLTLPGVRVVVDSGLERRTHYRNGRTVLALSAISQAAADQRSGRAGRLGPGLCVRLWGKAARLEPYTPPEVVREDPSEFVLAAAACGRRIQDLQPPDPIPGHSLDKAVARLRNLGALDRENRITEHGKKLFVLPLDAQLAHLIASASTQDSRADLVDLSAALSAQGTILPSGQTEKGRMDLAEFAPEACDACTLIRLLRFNPPGSVKVNSSALSEARRIAGQIREVLELGSAPGRVPERDTWVMDVLRADPDLAFVRRVKRSWCLGNGSEEVEMGSGSRMQDKHLAALVLDRHSIPGSKGTTRTVTIATCLAPVSFQEVAGAGLGEVTKREPRWEKGRIVVNAERIYAGRVIDSQAEKPQGRELCAAVAELVFRGELWSGLGERLQEEIQAWNLYCRLGLGQGEEQDPVDWLTKRLVELGLEESEDLEVLEPGDLEFPGIPDWEREEFDRMYPRRINLANLKLSVQYEPAAKRITLVRDSGLRKSPPQRWELPPWGRNWELRFQDGNRNVPIV